LSPGVRAEGGTGVGVMIGEPTGLSLKRWLDNNRAIDAGLAWSFSDGDSLHLHADYLIHDFTVLKPKDFHARTAFYYGIGGRIKFREHGDTRAGVRIPLGIDLYPANTSIDFFGEFAPIVDLAPSTRADADLAIGVRYFFK